VQKYTAKADFQNICRNYQLYIPRRASFLPKFS